MLHTQWHEEELSIARGADGPALVVQNARRNQRPFLHPILAPDGLGTLTEDAPPHHPWQHGLYTGLNDVNGVGFWTEGLRGSPSDGTFHPHPLSAPTVAGDQAHWQVSTEWRGPDGQPLLNERQAWTLTDAGSTFSLSLDWTLQAIVDLAFGQYAYGGLFLRMPFRTESGGEAVNSAGQRNQEAENQTAEWVALSMPIPDRPHSADDGWAGIAIFDHPTNRVHPTPWRVDNQLGISPSPCIAGAWSLAAGAESRQRHGLLVYTGRTRLDAVADHYRRFVQS